MVTVMTVINAETNELIFNGRVEPDFKGDVEVPYTVNLKNDVEYKIIVTNEVH